MLSDHKRESEGGGVVSSKIYRTTSWYDARVEIRPSFIQGGGMFARQPIQAGEIVAIVGGTVMTEDEFHAYLATTSRFNATQIGECLHLVDLIQAPENVAGSINHSCDSNLWLQDEVTIVARRGIAPSVVHAHDWQAGLAPVYLKTLYATHPILGDTPSSAGGAR